MGTYAPLVPQGRRGRVSWRSMITVNPTFCSWYPLCILFRFHVDYRRTTQSYRRAEKVLKKKEEKIYRKPGSYDDCLRQTQLLRLPTSESKSSNLFYPPAGSPDKEESNHCVLLNPLLQVGVTYPYQEERRKWRVPQSFQPEVVLGLCLHDLQAPKSWPCRLSMYRQLRIYVRDWEEGAPQLEEWSLFPLKSPAIFHGS